jgi:DNA polymerase IIIc chi subunit
LPLWNRNDQSRLLYSAQRRPFGTPGLCLQAHRKSLAHGHRIYLHCSDAAQRDDLDARLWAFKGESFVPHGPADSEPDGLIVLGVGDDCGQHQDCWSIST